MTFRFNSDIIISAILLVQYCCPISAQYSNLLDLFGVNTGRSGTVRDRIPIDDITRLQKPLPQVALLDGIPAVPGIIGSFPGIGGCLFHQTPFVNQRSPNLFQNFLRFIPGAQDYLSDLVKTPIVDLHSLMGKYYWVISTAGVHDRYCPTTENLTQVENTSTFSTMDSFHVNGPHGAPKMGFGYGIIHNKKVYIYVQEDPCPYQIIITGPKNAETGQYEYIVITNWAKFPLVAMTRNLAHFNANYRNELIQIIGNWMHQVDWTNCKPLTPITFISTLINRFIFGL
uniref:NIDO domain-containing protein n=1 Tax=Elaeophora elaphi TaxID=1147741 RepID=A0A0R3S022_9BILA